MSLHICHCGERKDPEYDECYDCAMKADGKVKCVECDEHWHSLAFDRCYDCNEAKRKKESGDWLTPFKK